MAKKKEDTITLEFTNYLVKGISDLTMWGGGNSCIVMEAFGLKVLSKKNLLENINDNGFGVESINGAICDVYKNYDGFLKFYKTIAVGDVSEDTEDYYQSDY